MLIDFGNTEFYTYVEKVRELNKGEIKKIHVITFGCQQNEADSEKIIGVATDMGYLYTDTPDEADLIVLNTCAIRKHAEERALSLLGRFKAIKKRNPI